MAVPGRTLSSMSWTAAGQVATTAINFGVSVALARLLAPHDFGVVALAVGLQIVLGALTDFGLAALVIRADLPPAQLNGLFRLRLAVGALQALALWLAAPALASALNEPQVAPVLRGLCAVVLIASVGALPEALLRKALRFRALVAVTVAMAVLSGVTGIGMAWAGFGVWSLVGQSLVGAVAATLLHGWLARWSPTGDASYAALRTHRSYVAHTYGLNVVGALVWQADRLILGRLLGAAALGLYMRGLGLAQQLQSLVASAAEQVGFPTLAAMQQHAAQTRAAFLQMVSLLATVLAPCMLVLAALSEPLVLFLFGERWHEAHPILRLLSIGLLFNALTLTWDWLLRAIGRADTLFRWSLFDGTTRLAALFAGAWWGGAVGAAAAYLGAALPLMLTRVFWIAPVAGLGATTFLQQLVRPLAGGLACATAAAAATLLATRPGPQLALGGAAAGVTYLAAAALFGDPLLARLRERRA